MWLRRIIHGLKKFVRRIEARQGEDRKASNHYSEKRIVSTTALFRCSIKTVGYIHTYRGRKRREGEGGGFEFFFFLGVCHLPLSARVFSLSLFFDQPSFF